VSAPRARAFVTASLYDHSLPTLLIDDVGLVGSELATNALVHTHAPFTMRLSRFERHLRLEVVDGSRTGPNPAPLRVFNDPGREMAVVQGSSAAPATHSRARGPCRGCAS
jgi:anti-sigma regulatory factor (Ser/Thr protein kinase)